MPLVIDTNAEPITGYRLIERIGGGGFGEVWKAEAPGGLLKAIKVIHGDLRSVDVDGARHAEQELRALKRLQGIRHPYLLSLERYDVIEGRLLIVTELADCNLWDRFREMRAQQRPGIPRAELLGYLEEAAEVLDLMNTQYQLQHLDIKPQNLFLVYNHVKVADFGLVKDLQGMRGQITGGVTPVYAAPETFDSIVTRYCDQYSLAIVYQEVLTGIRPFNGTSGQQLLLQHLREPPNLSPLPATDRAPVARALSKKPEDRFPTCLQFIRALMQAGCDLPAPASPPPTPASSRLETPVATGRTVPP
ncbi:MAG: serine/threonine protein kinase, partial [Zavarzinella sp.]|nr:serine/threonine protein kinase [Zavarzinella sp.]